MAVFATVTNAAGRLVPDLSRDDFAIEDNGKRQVLTVFSNDIQPITIVMLLDRSGSMKPNFDLEEQAAEAFVGAMGPADKARIGSFSTRIQIDPHEFTSDRDALLKILRNDLQGEGPTPLWNAVNTGIDKLLLESGRRVVLVFTDGVDMPLNFSNGNKSLKDVMKRAEEDDIMVYAIGLAGENGMPSGGRTVDRSGRGGLGAPGGFGGLGGRGVGGSSGGRLELEKPDEGLPKIAAATGGGYFELTSARNLASTFARVADELHHQYALGFTPEKLDGKMHDLTVRLARPDLSGARAKTLPRLETAPGRSARSCAPGERADTAFMWSRCEPETPIDSFDAPVRDAGTVDSRERAVRSPSGGTAQSNRRVHRDGARPRGLEAAHVRDHLSPRCRQDDADREAVAVCRRHRAGRRGPRPEGPHGTPRPTGWRSSRNAASRSLPPRSSSSSRGGACRCSTRRAIGISAKTPIAP